jgi:hypothetical protein
MQALQLLAWKRVRSVVVAGVNVPDVSMRNGRNNQHNCPHNGNAVLIALIMGFARSSDLL